jgi:hypothetical protein
MDNFEPTYLLGGASTKNNLDRDIRKHILNLKRGIRSAKLL